MEKFQIKVGLARLTFIVIAIACFALFWYPLIDYAIVLLFVLICLGIFSISDVEISARLITIRKNYFWGIFGIKKTLGVADLVSIHTNRYDFDLRQDAGIYTDSGFDFIDQSTRTMTTVLQYKENGTTRRIQLQLSKDEYRSIARRIKSH